MIDYNEILPDESSKIEYKKNLNNLSNDIWETVSAFENTEGGVIVLGITEKKKNNVTSFKVTGVNDAHKVVDEFWSAVNNDVVSYPTVQNDDVHVLDIDDKKIIEISIPEAPFAEKPVYIKKDLHNAYVRKGSTDVKAKGEDLKTLIRDSKPDLDTKVLRNYWLDDLDKESLEKYKEEYFKDSKHKKYENESEESFLRRIGVISKDYDNDGKLGLTAGGLLFFGKNSSIIHEFPNFQLDLFDKSGPNRRYDTRISSIDEDLNIYTFFKEAWSLLSLMIQNEFKLNSDMKRIDTSGLLKEAVREGLLNSLMHADYYGEIPIVITARVNYFEFENPGKMKISREKFFTTTDSVNRNPIISKLFVQTGNGERAGQGGETIFSVAQNLSFNLPTINTDLKKTTLKIWKVEYADSFDGNQINENERLIIKALTSKGSMSKKEIEEKTGLTRALSQKAIKKLEDKNIIVRNGKSRATVYAIKTSREQLLAKAESLPDLLRQLFNDLEN